NPLGPGRDESECSDDVVACVGMPQRQEATIAATPCGLFVDHAGRIQYCPEPPAPLEGVVGKWSTARSTAHVGASCPVKEFAPRWGLFQVIGACTSRLVEFFVGVALCRAARPGGKVAIDRCFEKRDTQTVVP